MENNEGWQKIKLYMSALQKAIRWCEVNDARFFGQELLKISNPGTCFTRLKVMTAEDIGLADPTLIKYVWDRYDEFESRRINLDVQKLKASECPELCTIIDKAVIATALSYKSRHLAMLTFITLFDIYKQENFNTNLADYKKMFQVAIQERDEKKSTYYGYIIGVFLKSENVLFEMIQKLQDNPNKTLIEEWTWCYRKTEKDEPKFLTLAGITSLLCRDIGPEHGEYIRHVSDYLSIRIKDAVIPDRAYDMHTYEGRKIGRGLEHFFKEAASIKNKRFPDELEEEGEKAHFQSQRERISEGHVIEGIWGKCKDHGGQMKLPF